MIPAQDPAFDRMVNTARILIIDHDINRYHSFELYSYLLTKREYFFNSIDQRFMVDFINQSTLNKKVTYYLSKSPYLNPYQHFKDTESIDNKEYEEHLKDLLPVLHIVPTDISERLSPMLYNESVEGFLLKYASDPHRSSYENQVKVFKSDYILDGVFASAIIKKFSINTIFVSSIELAISIALKLYQMEYKEPLTFYVGIYRYNYDPETKSMKHTSAIAGLEYAVKHSFMSIDPFTSLSYDKDSQYDVDDEEGGRED